MNKRNYLGMFGLAMVVVAAVACGKLTGNGEISDTSTAIVPAPDLPKVVIGRVPSGNVLEISENMEPLIALMKEKLQIDVEVKFTENYAKFTQKMEAGIYDLAFCAPFQYIAAHEKTGYEAVLRPVRHGADTYVGIIITAKPEITSVAQLKGRNIAFVDKNSTSGYLFPLGLMISEGLTLNDFQTSFLGGHDNVVLNVLQKTKDAGACFKGAEVLYGKTRAHQLRIIAETDPIYNEPIAINPKFRAENPELAAKIVNFLQTMHETPEGQAAIKKLGDGVNRFVAATDSDYDLVRRYAEKLPPEVIKASEE